MLQDFNKRNNNNT